MGQSSFFESEAQREEYEQMATTLGEVYSDAVSLRNTFADTTRTSELRRDGRDLAEALDSVVADAEDLLRAIAEGVESVETEYMVSEGWELSFHDPDDLPTDLVFACRVFDRIVGTRNEINWLFDDGLSNGVPEGEEITRAADRVAGHFSAIASIFDTVAIEIPGVEPENQTQALLD